MRASRLLSVLLLLQNRGRLTAAELAEELEVSVRTVYRDIESLAAAGIPVYAEHGPAGGYQLVSGYRTRLTGLTEQEADTLFLAGAPGPAAQLGLGADLAAAQLKVEAALSPDLRARAGRIRERFHLDAPSWFRSAEETGFLAEVADAVWHQRRIRMLYQGWNARLPPAQREVDPLGVVCKAGQWYLVAAAPDGKPRTYRVVRIQELTVTDERFDRPAGFRLAEFWAGWAEQFESNVYRAEMTVRLAPAALGLLVHIWSQVPAEAAQAAGPPDERGWRRAVIPIESEKHAVHEVLKLGPLIEVLEPESLREWVAREAAETVALYGK
ncbi:MAG TPA: WYL domain-containing protein [Pseudonocardiaceae bacterium]|jgi:predicted DNA-binding transcriptional regulator YafY|nr:WYL domain-containing protein [Pseudonocardiaceae bacterium]